ncbi:ABC transporter substrate-binding protein [Ciceribacter selenitireducens]
MHRSYRKYTTCLGALALVAGLSGTAYAEDGLKIGAVFPLTGTYASYGKGMSAALKIALEEINAAGGVLGKPVTLVVEDDQTDPTAGLNAAKKVVEVDKVSAIVSTFATSVTLPILSYTTQIGVPIATVSGAPEVTQIGKDTGLVYRFVYTEGRMGDAMATYALKAGYKRAYVLKANNAAMIDSGSSFAKRFKADGGELLGETTFEPSQSSYRSELTKALADEPELVMIGGYTNDAITLAKALYQLSPETKIVGPLYSLGTDFIKAVGPEVSQGALAVDPVASVNSRAYKSLAPLYTAAVNEDPIGNPYAVIAYDELVTFALAAEAAKSTDAKVYTPFIAKVANAPGEKVHTFAEGLAAIKAGKDIDYDGASSPVDFDGPDLSSMFMQTYLIADGKVVAKDTLAP